MLQFLGHGDTKRSRALLLLCATFALAQTTEKTAKPAPPEPFAVNVSGATWESGEMKTCSTYFNHPKFLLCNEDVRFAVTVGWMDHKEIDPERLIRTMDVEHSKRFLVQFSQLPWRLAQPDPDKQTDEPGPIFVAPTAGSRDMESRWDCSKDKTITCKFLKSF